jgi:hypothetical protein
MFDDVVGNPKWNAIVPGVFGTNITVLPFQDVSAPQGYMLTYRGQSGYPINYSCDYPIIIESSTGGSWSNEFYFCLYGVSAATLGYGPCQVSGGFPGGIVEAKLYDGSNTNGLDINGGGVYITNSIMGRFGLGSCDSRYVTIESRSSVSFVYFNLPPHPVNPDFYCNPIANVLNQPFVQQWCGFGTNYTAGFIMSAVNNDNPRNWRYPGSSCDSNTNKQFRVRFDGNQCCDSQACASTPSLIYGVSAGKMNLSFQLQPGFSYEIVYKNDLRDTNWLTLLPWIGGTGTITLHDPMTSPKRFYRLNYTTE